MNEVDSDIYVYAHATAPFVSVESLSEGLNRVIDGGYDSAFTAVRIQDFLWKNGQPMNFDATNLPRSQDLEPIYRETSGIYIYKKEVFTKVRRRIGETPYIIEVGYKEAIDINEKSDFDLAQIFLDFEG